jgi:hypothetical protein
MALPQQLNEISPLAESLAAARGRRCTYRRLGRIDAGAGAAYEVSCLYPDRRIALPLGDLDAASVICGPCQATHVFRPDED